MKSAIWNEYRATLKADGKVASKAGLRIRWGRRDDEGYRSFSIIRDGKLLASGEVDDWGAWCSLSLQS